MKNSVSNSVKQLEGQVKVLSDELKNTVDAIAFIKRILHREEETFAHTNQQAGKTYIEVTTRVGGFDLDFKVEASEMLSLLQKPCNNQIKLEKAKARLAKIKALMEEE